jgi:hypothetical protein
MRISEEILEAGEYDSNDLFLYASACLFTMNYGPCYKWFKIIRDDPNASDQYRYLATKTLEFIKQQLGG